MGDVENSGGGFGIGSSIPVLRMLDEARAQAFYVDFLGYQVEWEHRFGEESEGSPLYMQVRLGDSVLHLNGHAGEGDPVAEVRVPVRDVEGFCEQLRSRTPPGGEMPEVVDPRYEGKLTDLNLVDPSGNLVVFWLRE